jgi:hypothetical protein
MRVGYARVSSRHQSLDRQVTALEDHCCDEIFKEKAISKTTRHRPQLERAIARLGKDDVLVVAEWDRATRSMMDSLALMARIHAAGATGLCRCLCRLNFILHWRWARGRGRSYRLQRRAAKLVRDLRSLRATSVSGYPPIPLTEEML